MFTKFASRLPLLLLFAATLSLAQGTSGSIVGTVTDPRGAVLPGSSVNLLNTATGIIRRVQTDRDGLYTFPALAPGVYNITVMHTGFQTQAQSNITIQVQQAARIDFSLAVGQTSQTVNVVANEALLSQEDVTIGQVVENKRVVELPLNGRNYLQLATLSAGATNTSPPSEGNIFQGGPRGSESLTINGQRNGANNYTLDGIENTDPNFNSYILQPSIDAIQEFKIQSATYPADYGWAITQINVDTKSGTDQIHGSAFDFLRNSWFDAKNYFDSSAPIPEFHRNQYGGTVGGPILRKRLFYFGNYEGLRDSKGQTILGTVPSPTLMGGNFSGDKVPIYDPATLVVNSNGTATGTPFPGNIIPSTRFNPISVALMQYYGSPNRPGVTNNHVNNEALTDASDQTLLRIDYQMSTHLSWFGRWNYDKDSNYLPSTFLDQGSLTSTRPDQVAAGGIQILGSHVINDERFGWTRFVNNLTGYNAYKNDVNGKVLHIPGINSTSNPAFWGIPTISITGYSSFGEPTTVYLTHNNIWEGHDTVSWTRGKHFMTFGGEYQVIHYNQTGNQFALGDFRNNGTATGNPAVPGSIGDPVADFLLGYISFNQTGFQPATALNVTSYYAGFANDVFHVTHNLTLSLGLRYEYLRPFKDLGDMSSNVSDLNDNPPVLVRASNEGANLDPYAGLAIRLANITLVRDGSLGPWLVNADRNNFAPRIGLDYSPDRKTVVRVGFGTFYDMLDMGNSIYDMSRTLAGAINDTPNYPYLNLTFQNPTGSTASSSSATTLNVSVPTLLTNNQNNRTTYINQWTLDIQRSLTSNTVLDIAYVGSQGHKLKRETGLNMPTTPGASSVQSRRPFQYIGLIQYTSAIGDSNYNGLQAKIEKKLSGGMTLLSAYTYSRAIDNTSGVRANQGGDVLFPNNPFELGRQERGPSVFNATQRWITSGLIQSPFGSGQRFAANRMANALLGDWQLGGIFAVQTGSPDTATDAVDVTNIGNGAQDRPNYVPGVNPNNGPRTPFEWFNTSAFVVQPAFTYGTASRNTIIGPGLVQLDMSLMKAIPIGDRVVTQLRWDLFNSTNHPIFGLPAASIGSATFGQISSTNVDSREMQISMRIVF